MKKQGDLLVSECLNIDHTEPSKIIRQLKRRFPMPGADQKLALAAHFHNYGSQSKSYLYLVTCLSL